MNLNKKLFRILIFSLFIYISSIPLAICNPFIKVNTDSVLASSNLTQKDYIDINSLGQFVFPIPGKVISHYGKRGKQQHPGTDIKLFHGDSVRAAFHGVVTRAMRYYGYGNLVVLNHGQNTETYYAHLSKILVHTGDTISEGTIVGLGGRTGLATTDHLHFEVRVNGKTYNPELLFDFNNHLILSNIIYLKQPIVNPIMKDSLIRKSIVKANPDTYTIKKNDTLFSLAKRYGTTVNSLCKINGITNASKLRIGEIIKISAID